MIFKCIVCVHWQAASIKNIDVINTLSDPARQAEGHRLLAAYCTAFNASFPLVEYLYECNPNPFLTDTGAVDLTGSRGKGGSTAGECGMSPHTTLNFSLPSASHGETDATGLCTIKLLSSLEVSPSDADAHIPTHCVTSCLISLVCDDHRKHTTLSL